VRWTPLKQCLKAAVLTLSLGRERIKGKSLHLISLASVLDHLGVIPGKLAIASATRNPGKLELLDTRFRGYDGWVISALFCELWFQLRNTTIDLLLGNQLVRQFVAVVGRARKVHGQDFAAAFDRLAEGITGFSRLQS
jgi:hypothetical protein